MNTESQGTTPEPGRYQLALESLSQHVTLTELSYMLVRACEETIEEGNTPEEDPAVILISGRIGFASPADTMSSSTWEQLVEICEQNKKAKVQFQKQNLN